MLYYVIPSPFAFTNPPQHSHPPSLPFPLSSSPPLPSFLFPQYHRHERLAPSFHWLINPPPSPLPLLIVQSFHHSLLTVFKLTSIRALHHRKHQPTLPCTSFLCYPSNSFQTPYGYIYFRLPIPLSPERKKYQSHTPTLPAHPDLLTFQRLYP